MEHINQIDSYDFHVPEHLIAQAPANPRDSSKLLYVNRGIYKDMLFNSIDSLINVGDVLILNDAKVLPSRLKSCYINDSKASIFITLVKKISSSIWQIMAKPARKLSEGDIIYFAKKQKEVFCAKVVKKRDFNYIEINFLHHQEELDILLEKYGYMPLPPYIKRQEFEKSDTTNYQTIFALNPGAFAAPTAGLHFTKEILDKLLNKGVIIRFITLYVGLGTFLPVSSSDINNHFMHSEDFFIPEDTKKSINTAKLNGKRVICVGTTVLRAIESAFENGKCKSFQGTTNIFIKPGYKFNLADCLITNFHLPKSTLLILVSAFCGLQNIKNAYSHAVKNNYRFFSYGDACFLERSL